MNRWFKVAGSKITDELEVLKGFLFDTQEEIIEVEKVDRKDIDTPKVNGKTVRDHINDLHNKLVEKLSDFKFENNKVFFKQFDITNDEVLRKNVSKLFSKLIQLDQKLLAILKAF